MIGCVVNGPGEARETDIGFTGGGNGTHQVYISGLTDHRLKDADIVDHLVELVEKKAAEIEAAKQQRKRSRARSGAVATGSRLRNPSPTNGLAQSADVDRMEIDNPAIDLFSRSVRVPIDPQQPAGIMLASLRFELASSKFPDCPPSFAKFLRRSPAL